MEYRIVDADSEQVVREEATLTRAKTWAEYRTPEDFFILEVSTGDVYYFEDSRWYRDSE